MEEYTEARCPTSLEMAAHSLRAVLLGDMGQEDGDIHVSSVNRFPGKMVLRVVLKEKKPWKP